MNLKQFKADNDRISSLPDDVLTHILSFLPTKLAVATSILSTRWKHLSDFVQDIDLADDCVSGYREIDDASLFMQFVLKVLMVRTSPKIRNIPNFYLFCTIRYNHATLSQLILLLLMRDIRTLHLHVHLRETDALPDEIFTCKSLEVLEVGGELHFRIPESIILPNLKAIELHDVDLDNDFSIRKLLSGCPVLEDLLLYDCQLGKEDNMIDISHALLKNLVLNDCWGKYSMILDTPNLQSLLYASFGHVNIKVKNMMSLVHAHISWGSFEIQADQLENQDPNLLLESSQGTSFMNAMHKARFLYLEGSTLNALHFSDGPLTTFHNLIFLELGYFDICRQLVLPELLESTPNLEELVFYEGFLSYGALERQLDHPTPNKIPACFSRRLEEIKFRVFEGHELEVELVEYFLKNVQHLKMMMIGSLVSSISPFGYRRWNLPCLFQEETPKWVRPVTWRLSAAPRCSKYCQIVLSWGEEPKLYSWRVSSMVAYKNNYGDRDFVTA